jgi:Tfp pilus assembly protein PilV
LVEVIVAMMLVLVAVTAVMSVLTTSKQSVGRSQRRVSAAMAARRVTEALKVYDTADTTVVAGPGVAPNGWGLPGDSCNCAALRVGTHTLNPAVWAPDLASAGGTISYTVATTATALGLQPTVTLDVKWSEP